MFPGQATQVGLIGLEHVSFSRLLLNGEEIVCVDFHFLPPAKRLQDILHELHLEEVAAESVWDRFLAALQELSCQVIQSQGRVGACPETLAANFVEAAREAALKASIYDPSYRRIPRTGGDVPADRGVCSDVIIRALRDFGIDLQQLVWEDIRKNPQAYNMQETWGRSAADPNIDHRRVRNLLVYFGRHPERFAVLNDPDRNWQPGDIVVWNLTPSPKLRHHIGIVSDKRGESGDWMVIHHLPPSGSEDDRLHHWEILAHIRPLL